MIENLKRIREPLTWAVIAIVAASVVLGITQLVLKLRSEVPVFAAFQEIGANLMNISLVVALVALVCTCFFITPATRHALRVTKVGAWVLTVGVLINLVCVMLGVAASANSLGVVFETLGGLLDLVLKGLAAGVLWVLVRGVDAGRIDTATVEEPAKTPAIEANDVATTWQRNEATGTVWRTADEAATGAPGAVRMPGTDLGHSEAIFRDEADPKDL